MCFLVLTQHVSGSLGSSPCVHVNNWHACGVGSQSFIPHTLCRVLDRLWLMYSLLCFRGCWACFRNDAFKVEFWTEPRRKTIGLHNASRLCAIWSLFPPPNFRWDLGKKCVSDARSVCWKPLILAERCGAVACTRQDLIRDSLLAVTLRWRPMHIWLEKSRCLNCDTAIQTFPTHFDMESNSTKSLRPWRRTYCLVGFGLKKSSH